MTLVRRKNDGFDVHEGLARLVFAVFDLLDLDRGRVRDFLVGLEVKFFADEFGGEDPLQPYKKTVDRWLWPDLFRGQRTSVSRAKGAITKYKQALGDPVV